MRPITLFLWLLPTWLCVDAQTYRRYIFHNTPIWNCTNEIYETTGQPLDTGQATTLLGTSYTHGQYMTFLNTENYATYTAKHYKTSKPLVPKCVYRTATHTYATAAYIRGSTSDYLLMKFQNDGTLLSIKKVGEFSIHILQAASIMLYPLPGTTDMLLCYHTLLDQNAELYSQIHLYTVDEDLNPSGPGTTVLMTEAQEQNYNILGNCSFYLKDSLLYYNLLMDNALDRRFETGHINIYTNEVQAQWSGTINAISYDQRNYVIQVKNDTIYHLVNSCLVIHPPGATSAIYYPFDNSVMDCKQLLQTEAGEWVGIFSDHTATSAVGIFSPSNQLLLFNYSPMIPSQIQARGTMLSVWGKHESCALALDEFTIPSIAQCHPPVSITDVDPISLAINPSQVVAAATVPGFTNVPLFAAANLNATKQELCNTITSVTENDALHIQVYPNPTADWLHIVSEENTLQEAALYHLTGKRVWQQTISTMNNLSIDMTALPAGMYVLYIQTAQGMLTQKISKQ